MGGDGTLNEVLNGIMSAVKNKPSLGHFPLGTANDFSKTLGLEKNLEQFLNLLNSNHTISIDVGKIICKNKQAVSERYFINIADAGLGGFVAHKLNNSKIKRKKSSDEIDCSTKTSRAPTHSNNAAIDAPIISDIGEENNLNISFLSVNL